MILSEVVVSDEDGFVDLCPMARLMVTLYAELWNSSPMTFTACCTKSESFVAMKANVINRMRVFVYEVGQ